MKWEKLVAIIGLTGLFIAGVISVISAFISDKTNYLALYEFWIGIVVMVLSSVFLRQILQKKKKRKK